jgi:hypothetical protein
MGHRCRFGKGTDRGEQALGMAPTGRVPGQAGRCLPCAIYAAIAVAALARNRRYILPNLTAPFRPGPRRHGQCRVVQAMIPNGPRFTPSRHRPAIRRRTPE